MKKNNSKKEGFFHHKFTNSPIPDIQQVETQEKKKPGNEINKRTRSKSKERSNRETQENQSFRQGEFEKENSQGRGKKTTNFRLQSATRKAETKRGEGRRRGREEKWINSASGARPNFHFPFFQYLSIRLEEISPPSPRPPIHTERTRVETRGVKTRVHLGNVFSNRVDRHLDPCDAKLVTRTTPPLSWEFQPAKTFPRRNFAVHLHAVPESLHFISVQVYK